MLIRFTDDYITDILTANNVVAGIHCTLAKLEPFKGNSPDLDYLYTASIMLSGIVDSLSNDDNSDPRENEALRACLRKIISKVKCANGCIPPLNLENYHNKPVAIDTPFIQ
jgi:hypothetical protein